MKYLRKYNELISFRLFESIDVNDINDLFLNISDISGYDVNCKRVSKKYVEEFIRVGRVYGDDRSLSDDFTESDYSGDRFLVTIKSINRLEKRRQSTSVDLFSTSIMDDDIKFVDDYLKSELGVKIRIIEIYHVIKLPKIYSSSTTVAHTKITDNQIFSDRAYDSNSGRVKAMITQQEGSIIDKLRSFNDIKRLNIIIF